MCFDKVIVVNGVFDVLHTGHLNLFSRAKDLGDYLVVLIDSDARVKQMKGPSRPINDQHARARMLSALRSVDEVQVFNTDFELERLIKCIQPYYMVKGADYKNKPIIGSQWCKNIEYVELNDKSTSSIVNR